MWNVDEVSYNDETHWAVMKGSDYEDIIALCASHTAALRICGALNKEKPLSKILEAAN